SYQNQQQFHVASGTLLVPGRDTLPVDTLHLFKDSRQTTMSINTPLRIGRWNWANSISVSDVRANGRQEFTLRGDSTGGVRRVLYGETFETQVDWQDRKSTRLNSSHLGSSYAVFCLKKKIKTSQPQSC